MPRFDPFGVFGGEPEEPEFTPMPTPGLPPGIPPPEMIEQFMKATGMIPPYAHVEIVALGVEITSGGGFDEAGVDVASVAASMEWSAGDPLPHTSRTFDDPPFMMSPDEWRGKLVRAVREYDDPDDFSFELKAQLGNDMVKSHKVPVDTAMAGCEEFAAWLWSEYRYAGQPG